ncbi:MAG: hypothetical protein ACK5PS_09125 [Desulfopila sp.]
MIPIPSPDTIPVDWGWFMFLLLLTFPLHLLAMNGMLGALAIAVGQQFLGGSVRIRLAHRLAVALPLLIAFAVNLGVAPLLFLQVLYGQFVYTSSILMGVFWLAIIPVLIIAYYGAYLYDFRFARLGTAGMWIGLAVLCLFLVIAYFFSNNMLLMSLPERFAEYFDNRGGTLLASAETVFLPRYLHMITGALAIGGLGAAVLAQFRKEADPEMAAHGLALGMRVFRHVTLVNLGVGVWFLLALDRERMLLFMGRNLAATLCFSTALILIVAMLWAAHANRLWTTVGCAVSLVYLMSFMRSWLRADSLLPHFSLNQLQVIPEYSPMLFFFATLIVGIGCIVWLVLKVAAALRNSV